MATEGTATEKQTVTCTVTKKQTVTATVVTKA